ncbi:MAG TPA: N-acetylglucosamine-6-phosphate deacetylase [Armatimonadota bacterium]|jgi:N-acetylglucosamine-6-phosphate deacetylase
MRTCPACGAGYDVTEAVCAACGAELPAPYENADFDDETDDGYDSGDFPNPRDVGDGESGAGGVFADGSVWQLAGERAFAPTQLTILSGAEVLLAEQTLEAGTVVLAAGRIVAIYDHALPNPQDGSTFHDLTGKILAPGLIDVHVHGMMGIDTNEASVEDFQRLSGEAAKHGITALCPTSVACAAGQLSTVLHNLQAARTQGLPGARLLGLHMESNFISPEYKGAQPPTAIFSPDDTQAWPTRTLIDEYAREIAIVTVAPEVPGVLDLIPWLCERDIRVSLGHSAANYEQAVAGFDAGATHVTHLFNAMPPLHHRAPGLVGAALERDDVYTEIICDGMHVHPAVLSTVFTAKGAERVMVISDALRGAGLPTGGEFTLGGQHITVQDGVARLDNGTIAGSITTMDSIVRLLVAQIGWDLGEAVLMAATTPADGLGLPQLGRLAPGALADLVVFDAALEVTTTYVNGRVVYQR